VWQIAAPVYAQAVASHWLDVLFNGELLQGDMPVPPISCQVMLKGSEPMQWVPATGVENCQAPSQPYVSYRFWAGSQSNAVFIRKLVGFEKYVIAGTVQPQSNVAANTPETAKVTIHLPSGAALQIEIRRQGSVYVFENDTTPVMTQVDAWHESSHFARWSTDLMYEAELHDQHATPSTDTAGTNGRRVTEQPEGAAEYDYTSFVTYVEIDLDTSPLSALRFAVQPRRGNDDTVTRAYTVNVRCRVQLGATVELIVGSALDTVATTLRGSGETAQWQWQTLPQQVRFNTDSTNETISLTTTGSGLFQLDQLRLVEA
jgi:hypothetical protein